MFIWVLHVVFLKNNFLTIIFKFQSNNWYFLYFILKIHVIKEMWPKSVTKGYNFFKFIVLYMPISILIKCNLVLKFIWWYWKSGTILPFYPKEINSCTHTQLLNVYHLLPLSFILFAILLMVIQNKIKK